jgi:hypothetical protein
MYRNTYGLLSCVVVGSLLVLRCHSPKFNTVLQEPKADVFFGFMNQNLWQQFFASSSHSLWKECAVLRKLRLKVHPVIKSAMALCILVIDLEWNEVESLPNMNCFADLCFDVNCIKF